MKILYLANLRLPTEKAYGIQIAKMCEAFANLEHQVSLVYPHRKNPSINQDIFSYYSIKNNFTVKEVRSPDFYLPGFLDRISFFIKSYLSARALTNEALRENADIYYTRDELVAYLLSKQNKNIIFECHRFSNKRKLFYSHFKKINLKIIAISDGLKEDLVKFGIKDSSVLVARDGVDLEEFNVNLSKIDSRKMFFSNFHPEAYGRKKLAVYVGHLYWWKGVNIFSEIAKYLCDKNVNYLICVFGNMEKEVRKLQEEFRNIVHLHPSLQLMVYLGDGVPHRDVPYILKAADCAILTGNESETISAKYTSPLKMFEYMASGCPIVAQDLPSFREVLNNENSFFVEPSNAKALAGKISEVFENEEKAKERAQKAFEDVQKYTWSERARKILDFLKN